MEVLMSNWSNVVQSLPEKYVFPPEKRPGKDVFPVVNDVPVIDLEIAEGHGRGEIVHQILHACQQFGFFQVINHGVPVSLMDDTMNVLKEFFGMSAECRIYSSTMSYDNEEVHYWRDNFTHHCHPLEDQLLELWPEKPIRYREVVGAYSVEVRKLLFRILDVISEGLGLKLGYFDAMSYSRTPSLSPGQWMNVDPMPNAFVVIPGLQLKVISNGKFSSPIHRVMTHPKEGTTMGTFLIPSHDMLIHPPHHAPLYRAFTYQEFFTTFTKNNCDADIALEYFKNKT
ncbi:UNVERIFIED_CONTAM: Hyoscyamine 6-dioxygenase [Sesamum angustifolium]|uniref:Hyoscyamine 6-dioxygenase n=1 Tax=Sesamum angustifolium TaxID=2727405 RepID=A0AAW2QSM7_9LAMI